MGGPFGMSVEFIKDDIGMRRIVIWRYPAPKKTKEIVQSTHYQ
jgi:hypothetical protein